MSDFIPIDVWEKVLFRLQVKSLLRFRCVSKAFRNVIDTRYFARLHLDYSTQTKSNLKVLVTSEGVLSIDYDTFDTAIRRTCPREWTSGTQYISSYHGVVLLFDGRNEFTLWNPSRRRYINVTLQAISIPLSCFYEKFKYSLGFGYTDADDDYKVVKVVHHDWLSTKIKNLELLKHELLKKVEVYSLKSNSWRRVRDFPFNLHLGHHHATFVSGAMHWICHVENDDSVEFIAAFDLRTEEYRIVPAPQYQGLDFPVKLIIGSFEGRLWVHCYSDRLDLQTPIADTWVMEKYGVRESWTKLFSSHGPTDFQQPVAYSRCGRYLLLNNCGNFQSYDLLREELDEISVRGLSLYYKADICIESLVHLNAGENNDENQQIRENVLIEEKTDNNDDSIFSMMANFFIQLMEVTLYEP